MKNFLKTGVFSIAALTLMFVLTGCTNWEKKYDSLNVEHQNLKGLYDNCRSNLESAANEKSQLNYELEKSVQTIEQLQQEIEQRHVSPAEASGFGEGMDVTFDAAAGTITVTLQSQLLFSAGKATLKKSTISELDHIYGVLQQRYGAMPVDVVGHTDSDPIRKSGWKDNWELSAERALSVLRYLENKGMRPDQIRAVAAGASVPIASNSTKEGKSRNRRVEIVVRTRG